MELDELNEVASLLHITSEIATNHPKLTAIQGACVQRLNEINQELIDAAAPPKPTPPAEIKAAQHTTGKLSLKDETEVERRA
jgi:hypothetical protein